MKCKSISLLFIFLWLAGSYIYGQAPVNDDYTGAIELIVNESYEPGAVTSGSTINATQSEQPVCQTSNAGYYSRDVWFKFKATHSSHILQWSGQRNNFNNREDIYCEVFRQNGGQLGEQLVCEIPGSRSIAILVENLVAGETLFIRAYSRTSPSNTTNLGANFNVSVLTAPVPPVNDSPAGAISLQINTENSCNFQRSGTTKGATKSEEEPLTNGNDVVWYKFTATSATHEISISDATIIYGPLEDNPTPSCRVNVYKILPDGQPGAVHLYGYLTTTLVPGLVVGENYLIQFSSWASGVTGMDFNICIKTPEVTGNDEYTSAGITPVSTTGTCSEKISLRTIGATRSMSPSCSSENDDDIWVRFTATQKVHELNFDNVQGSAYNISLNFEVFTIVNNAPGTRIDCGSSGLYRGQTSKVLIEGFTSGESYFIRFYTPNNIDRVIFDLCASSPPSPLNDDYANAISIPASTSLSYCSSSASGNNYGASLQSTPTCNGTTAGDKADIWYTFAATRASHILRLTNSYGGGISVGVEVFENTGNAPGDRIFCNTFYASWSTLDNIVTGLEASQTYYVRIYSSASRVPLDFTICLLNIEEPANDQYAQASLLSLVQEGLCSSVQSFTTLGATPGEPDACQPGNLNDIWFKFNASHNAHRLRFSNVSYIGGGYYSQKYIEVFSEEDGAPASRIFCNLNDYEVTINNLTAGRTYFIRIYTYNNQYPIRFNLCLIAPAIPVNDECANAIDISHGNQTVGTNVAATQSRPPGNCSQGPAEDVWYKINNWKGGTFSLYANAPDFDLVLEVFKGSCSSPSFESIACQNVSFETERVTIENASQGYDYYFRVYAGSAPSARTSASNGAFVIQFAEGNALPVTLASFKAFASESNSVRLDWATAEEASTSHFELEHSLTGKTWSKIGEMKAAGNNTGLKSYTYIHTNPPPAVNYYRLKSVDLDGTFAYSAIESIRLGGIPLNRNTNELFVYPNPVSDRLYLNIEKPEEITAARLYNASGHEVKAARDIATGSLDVRRLPAGFYLLQVERIDGTAATIRVVIDR